MRRGYHDERNGDKQPNQKHQNSRNQNPNQNHIKPKQIPLHPLGQPGAQFQSFNGADSLVHNKMAVKFELDGPDDAGNNKK